MSMAVVLVFAYNFPHRKTHDVLVRLHLDGHDIAGVIAADKVKLNVPLSTIRTTVRHGTSPHPQVVAKRLGAPYFVAPHNSPRAADYARGCGADVSLIAGARILKPPIIDAAPGGIINLHPGLIPEARGLDALLWSIHHDLPLGVTTHFIDEHVDAGELLMRKQLDVLPDDTLFDLSERIYHTQLDLMTPSIEAALNDGGKRVDPSTPYNRKMPAELEAQTIAKVGEYVQKHSR